MNRVKLPISSILVKDRQRLDYGDLSDLQNSMSQYGLIQPIVLNQDNRLIAGGRRLASATALGWKEIDVCYKETFSEDELHIFELEENLRRKDEVWQERCLHIAHIHRLKKKIAAVDGIAWSQKVTGQMLGISDAHVNYILAVAVKLRAELGPDNKPLPSSRFWKCDSLTDAWRLILRNEEDAMVAELSRRQKELTNTSQPNDTDLFSEFALVPSETIEIQPSDNNVMGLVEDEVIAGFSREASFKQFLEANPSGTRDTFLANWEKFKTVQANRENTIHLSPRLIQGDSIAFMNDPSNEGRFDHIITDIPYGIDMEYLNQQNPHGGMVDIDTVEAEHDVDYNLDLIRDFFPAAFRCTKETAFVITWCDLSGQPEKLKKVGCVTLWEYLMKNALEAGFAVQRWPITWFKLSACMNQCAQYNFTKNVEYAIVCRKKNTMLRENQPSSVVAASKDDLCDQINHKFAKPFSVWEFLIQAVSMEGQHILEPFAGRGSGIISLLRLGRAFTGVELNVDHYNHLLENVKKEYLLTNPNYIFK